MANAAGGDTRFIQGFCTACGTIVDLLPAEADSAQCGNCAATLPAARREDVFISYSTPDLPFAQGLAVALANQGVGFWLAPEAIQPTESFLEQIAGAIPRTRLMVFLLSEQSIRSPWVLREAVMGISNQKVILAVRVGPVRLTRKWELMLTDIQWDSVESRLEGADLARLSKLISWRLAPAAAVELAAPEPAPAADELRGLDPMLMPYPGPQPYSEAMEGNFFGRSAELRILIEHLKHSAAVLLISPSGAGKSSLLAAGLVPVLRKAAHQVFTVARVGRSLPEHLKNRSEQVENIFTFSTVHGLDASVAGDRLNLTVSAALASLPPPPPGRLRVLILDQFEEIFTQHTDCYLQRLPFVMQLRDAVRADPALRIVFAMRQEYLVDFQSLFEPIEIDFRPERFHLRRLERAGLAEIICRPVEKYVAWSDAAIDSIITQAKLIRVEEPDGNTVEKVGEYVELVHLQIICQRLWQSLPAGIRHVDLDHLTQAASKVAGQTFSSFVKNALDRFYNDVVIEVAQSRETEEHGKFSVGLIKLGCMKFVSREGTRQAIQEGEEHTGRLPNWIVKQLADRYLLRIDNIGRERWYELSHDLLAVAVAREIDPRVNELLFASDRLEKELKHLAQTRGQSLAGFYETRRELLDACDPFRTQPGLYANESEFLFRIALASGERLEEWSNRLREDHPEVFRAVLLEALGFPDATVRCNALWVFDAERDRELLPRLIDIGMNDADKQVRKTAARTMLRLDDRGLFGILTDKLDDPAQAGRAGRLSAMLLAMSDVSPRSHFDGCYRGLRGPQRRRVRLGAWRERFVEALPILPYALIPTGIFGAAAAGLYKWIPASFNWALVQPGPSAGAGIFHGVTAGLLWGGIIPLGIAVHRLVFWNARSKRGIFHPFGTIVFGAIAGFIASAIIMLIIYSVYEIASLARMGWINSLDPAYRYTPAFWNDLLFKTRMGAAHLILGTCMGIGAAMTVNCLRGSEKWEGFLESAPAPTSLAGAARLTGHIARIVIRYALPIPVMLALGGWLVVATMRPGIFANPAKRHVLPGVIGDASTQLVGMVAAIVGLGVGIVVLRRGLSIPPHRDST